MLYQPLATQNCLGDVREGPHSPKEREIQIGEERRAGLGILLLDSSHSIASFDYSVAAFAHSATQFMAANHFLEIFFFGVGAGIHQYNSTGALDL